MRRKIRLLLLLVGAASGAAHASDDAVAAAEVLLRHDAATDHTYLHDNGARFRYFITSGGADLPAASLARLRDTGLIFLPGSLWTAEKGKHVGHDMHVSIGEPEPLPDGSFRITYGFYCGTLCHSGNTAILRHDTSGWRVVSSRLNSIS